MGRTAATTLVLDPTIGQGNTALAKSATGSEALRRCMHAAIDTGLGVVNVAMRCSTPRTGPIDAPPHKTCSTD